MSLRALHFCHSEPQAKNLTSVQGKLRVAIPIPTSPTEIAESVPKRKRGISLLATTKEEDASQ